MFDLKNHVQEKDVFIIAEVGQNHQGDLDLAREFIRIFAFEGADAVKFQTRNNKYLFSEDSYNAKYESENSFANTYGEHRESLELKKEWLPILKEDCKKHGVYFMSTPFDEPSLDTLVENQVDLLKIASFDLGNIPFIHKIAQKNIPIVISSGGGDNDQIDASIETIIKYHDQVALLHCVSEYPCEYNRLGLENISTFKNSYPNIMIGSSDHFNGTLSGPIAYFMGARVFEKHVTLNRAWKGTDHSFALEPEGFRKFVRDIKRVRYMLPTKPKDDLGNEKVFQKLGKSVIANKDLQSGHVIEHSDLSGRIFKNQIIPVRRSREVIGKVLLSDVKEGEPIQFSIIK